MRIAVGGLGNRQRLSPRWRLESAAMLGRAATANAGSVPLEWPFEKQEHQMDHAAAIGRRPVVRRACALALAMAMSAQMLAAQPDSPDVVFVGSSILRRWTGLGTQMAPLRVLNVSVDGADTSLLLAMLGSRVIPRTPKVVVYYGGSNDVDLDEPAPAIARRVIQFIERLEAALPEARFVFVSVNRSPDHQDRWPAIDDVNRQIQAYALTHSLVKFVDVNPVLFNADGSSRIELFMPDQRHLRPAAYQEFARILKPVLVRAME